ncbi:substrate-binding periplasmic protein [Pseudomonas sp. RL_15y_Pfl2_60]|uniref:substrate-binding periplasmic protein n=1 Tax=Pseudomonas sp. RL_15y_Pfl2_60 TaxID=3088709 RepID=UPI0030D895FD
MRAALLLVAMLSSFQVVAESLTLKVITDVWPPFRMLDADGKLYGLDIDLLHEIEQRSGYRFVVERAPWARGLAALKSGRADMMAGVAKTPAREHYINYLEPAYYACAPRIYMAPESAQLLTRYEQLAGLRIGYVLDSAYFEPFDSDTTLTKIAVSSESQLLGMLARGRIQAFVGTDCQVDFELRDPKNAKGIAKAAYRPESYTSLYLGFSREGDHAAAIKRVTETLHQLRATGWVARRAEHYGLEKSSLPEYRARLLPVAD